jgi:hypothetical protein
VRSLVIYSRPVAAYRGDETMQPAHDLLARRPPGRTQNGGDHPARFNAFTSRAAASSASTSFLNVSPATIKPTSLRSSPNPSARRTSVPVSKDASLFDKMTPVEALDCLHLKAAGFCKMHDPVRVHCIAG